MNESLGKGSSTKDLTAEELKETARRLAAENADDLSALDLTAARSFQELYYDENLGVWMIHWGDEADTGFHDHDCSSGAVHVVSGLVREERLRVGGPPAAREYGPGETFFIDATEIHRVVQAGAEPALTVHAYSPPLRRMGSYLIGEGGALTRHSVSHEQELRPLEAA